MSTAQRIAFLGLGVMGAPMAGHLARSGHRVTGYNRTASRAEAWREKYAAEGLDVGQRQTCKGAIGFAHRRRGLMQNGSQGKRLSHNDCFAPGKTAGSAHD